MKPNTKDYFLIHLKPGTFEPNIPALLCETFYDIGQGEVRAECFDGTYDFSWSDIVEVEKLINCYPIKIEESNWPVYKADDKRTITIEFKGETYGKTS